MNAAEGADLLVTGAHYTADEELSTVTLKREMTWNRISSHFLAKQPTTADSITDVFGGAVCTNQR